MYMEIPVIVAVLVVLFANLKIVQEYERGVICFLGRCTGVRGPGLIRTLQTMAEISVEKNSNIIFPAQFMTTVQEAMKMISGDNNK